MSIGFATPDEASTLVASGALVVDLSPRRDYIAAHVPSAVHLETSRLSAVRPPVGGLLPACEVLAGVLGGIGLHRHRDVVAYDAEGQGSGRLMWTLDVLGHRGRRVILDGGLAAWRGSGEPVLTGSAQRRSARYEARLDRSPVADSAYVLARLQDPDMALLDVRTPEEFRGEDVRAARGGHVPGAVCYDWRRVLDLEHDRRLRPADAIRAELAALGITPDREIVCYCQTHQRSSHTYAVLKALGFERVRGYHGAWSEWGNRAELPVETGD